MTETPSFEKNGRFTKESLAVKGCWMNFDIQEVE
jgi:hypothetical protein